VNSEGLLRIHFTSEDQGRLRLATATDWMWEVVLSLHLLQSGEPDLVFDPDLPPVLVLPIRHDPRWLSGSGRCTASAETLSDLLGDTRARILDLAGTDALATGAIAGKLRISAQTISYHTKILRDAGLITSSRHGASVVHHLTDMGVALLNGRPTPVRQW
jgi:DNA-binding transcriptional ArsR family regulator